MAKRNGHCREPIMSPEEIVAMLRENTVLPDNQGDWFHARVLATTMLLALTKISGAHDSPAAAIERPAGLSPEDLAEVVAQVMENGWDVGFNEREVVVAWPTKNP